MKKTRIGIIHHTLNNLGGEGLLSITLADELKRAGYRIVYYTVERTDWYSVRISTGIDFKPDEERSLFPLKIGVFALYQRPLLSFKVNRKDVDLLINTHGDLLPFFDPHITYMHYPTFSLWYGSSASVKYLKSIFWKVYFSPYYLLQRAMVNKPEKGGILITNSKFSREVIKKYLGRNALVVYPPVRLDQYLPLMKNEERKDIVVTISRFTPEKSLEDVLRIACALKRVKFILIGSTRSKISELYLSKLKRMAKKLNLENVSFLPNASFNEKIDLLSKSKVYLHTMREEHFGIAPVEGIASGCVPVVHRSGGPWMDILEERQGEYGFAYEEIEEASNYVEEVIENDQLRREIKGRNERRIEKFSDKAFRRRMLCIVEKMLEFLDVNN